MSDHLSYPGMPRWVKIFGIILIAVVLLAAIVIFTGIGGDHGPSRHLPSSSVTELGTRQS